MLLFSTVLRVNDSLTKDAFIKLVLDWNNSNPHKDNIIPGIVWNGEKNIRFGDEKLWLSIDEHNSKNIIAVRYEKIADNGVVWDTDYVMNFDEMRMSIVLDRSYLEEALTVDPQFSTPHFIKCLIDGGYVEDDLDIPVTYSPIIIDEENIDILARVINGESTYELPVVYVSKTFSEEDPVDLELVAKRLKGVAHVLVEKISLLNNPLRALCNDKNEYNGAVGVYFPGQSFTHKKFINHAYDGSKEGITERIIGSVIHYCNAQRREGMYTWSGVHNDILRQQLSQNVQETEEFFQSMEEELDYYKQKVKELTGKNDALLFENQGIRAKIESLSSLPLLYYGNEEEYFDNEFKEFLLELISDGINNSEEGSRRADVLKDIYEANGNIDMTIQKKRNELKTLLNGYKNLTGRMRQAMIDMGFSITEDGAHYKVLYYGDTRYPMTMAKTPSDGRTGKNTVTQIIKKVL